MVHCIWLRLALIGIIIGVLLGLGVSSTVRPCLLVRIPCCWPAVCVPCANAIQSCHAVHWFWLVLALIGIIIGAVGTFGAWCLINCLSLFIRRHSLLLACSLYRLYAWCIGSGWGWPSLAFLLELRCWGLVSHQLFAPVCQVACLHSLLLACSCVPCTHGALHLAAAGPHWHNRWSHSE